ncbi:MAG: nucleotidyltransferase [Gemmatimonadaceae bacterium]|nr:nucleotidyltransferase [Gemmatimonadaceae bacterium]
MSEFVAAGVDAIVVGAHALAAHGIVRATKDLDVWVRPSHDNASRVFVALARFGAPLENIAVDDLSRPDTIVQIGVPPERIDVITGVSGLDFDPAWARRVPARLQGVQVAVLGVADLIVNKRASGRLQDLADVEQLERLLAQSGQGQPDRG